MKITLLQSSEKFYPTQFRTDYFRIARLEEQKTTLEKKYRGVNEEMENLKVGLVTVLNLRECIRVI